jgi:hypothetical protein
MLPSLYSDEIGAGSLQIHRLTEERPTYQTKKLLGNKITAFKLNLIQVSDECERNLD